MHLLTKYTLKLYVLTSNYIAAVKLDRKVVSKVSIKTKILFFSVNGSFLITENYYM